MKTKVNKQVIIAVIMTSLLFLTGCWQPGAHIGGPYIAPPEWLIGTWTDSKDGKVDDNTKIFTLFKASDNVLGIKDSKGVVMAAHVVRIKGKIFLSIESKEAGLFGGKITKYTPYLVTQNDDGTISYTALSEYIKERFDDPAKVRDFIEENMHLSFFFESATTLYRR